MIDYLLVSTGGIGYRRCLAIRHFLDMFRTGTRTLIRIGRSLFAMDIHVAVIFYSWILTILNKIRA